MKALITSDEIKKLKTRPRHLSWKNVVPGIGVNPPIEPTKLKSGYLVSYTIDSIFEERDVKIEHVIIGASDFEPDPVDMDEIALAVMGRCVRAPSAWFPQEIRTHYVKLIGMVDEEVKRSYEAGIEHGITILEEKKK